MSQPPDDNRTPDLEHVLICLVLAAGGLALTLTLVFGGTPGV